MFIQHQSYHFVHCIVFNHFFRKIQDTFNELCLPHLLTLPIFTISSVSDKISYLLIITKFNRLAAKRLICSKTSTLKPRRNIIRKRSA